MRELKIRAIRVLLADDKEFLLESVSALLEAEDDLQVVGRACDGVEALRLAQELSPDVVILDISMPRMDGIEATRRLRQIFSATPILILSAHDSPCYLLNALRAGANGYVVKQRAGRELVSAVRAVLDGDPCFSDTPTKH